MKQSLKMKKVFTALEVDFREEKEVLVVLRVVRKVVRSEIRDLTVVHKI
jgi:hypothetical protein